MKRNLFFTSAIVAAVFSLFIFTQVKAALLNTSAVSDKVEAVTTKIEDAVPTTADEVKADVQAATESAAAPVMRRNSGMTAAQIKSAAEISTVVSTVNDLQEKASSTKTTVSKQLDDSVTRAIDSVITTNPEIQKESLKKAVQPALIEVELKQREVFNAPDTNTAAKVDELSKDIKTSIQTIEKKLSDTSGVKVSIDSYTAIQQSLEAYKTETVPYVEVLTTHKADLLFVDSDNDGISDYDEVNVFHTDPQKAKTVDGDLTDGQKVLQGINPRSTSSAAIVYKDVTKTGSTTPDIFSVKNIELKKTATSSEIVLQGHAAPNSIITLYIFSTPIIVAVKTDMAGQWTYSLDKELEDGNHEVYVATVDNSGRVLAKSNPIPFVKTAEAATLVTQNAAAVSLTPLQMLQEYFWPLLFVIFGLMFALGFFDRFLPKQKEDEYGPVATPNTSIPDMTKKEVEKEADKK